MTILAGRIPDRGITYSPAYMCVWLADVVAPGLTDRPMWINERVAWNYKPDQLKWATNGHVSELTLSRQLGEGPGRDLQEHPESPAGRAGDRVILRQGVDGIEWFRGYLGKTETRIGAEPDGETYRITAYGPEIVLDGNVVSGQWHKIPSADNEEIDDSLTDDDRNGSSAFRSQWPVIFNENGKPNASESNWRLGGSGNLGNH
ncbi:MAG TPA: hypothetical protein ENL03_02250 [Phycisphaerae bacterium]|nr:hypothetical protein [Phycisphaerae bacterium]